MGAVHTMEGVARTPPSCRADECSAGPYGCYFFSAAAAASLRLLLLCCCLWGAVPDDTPCSVPPRCIMFNGCARPQYCPPLPDDAAACSLVRRHCAAMRCTLSPCIGCPRAREVRPRLFPCRRPAPSTDCASTPTLFPPFDAAPPDF